MSNPDPAAGPVPVVRVAFGWRAREVERASTAHVQFVDQDVSVDIFEDGPVALSYAEPAHALTLPAGRYLRVDQAAGRVFSADAAPHMAALSPEGATALADSVGRLLDAAGWTRMPGEGRGLEAVADAARYARDGKPGSGEAAVGTWRVPRPAAPWAARPPGAPPRVREWDGVEANVTVRPVRAVSPSEPVKLILNVRFTDDLMNLALFAMLTARQARYHGEMQTLRSWDEQPTEPIAPAARP